MEEDRISGLPDCLLIEIIDRIKTKHTSYEDQERRMTTKEVIRTTATISKRWQHLWTLLPNRIFVAEDDVDCKIYLTVNGDLTDYFSFIDKTLTQCPTHVKLNELKLYVSFNNDVNPEFKSQVISWIYHAITHRKVQEVDFRFWDIVGDPQNEFIFDDALFFNNSCFTYMKLCDCLLRPPNGVISWENLYGLHLMRVGLDEDVIENIFSGTPCLNSLEFEECHGYRCIDITSKSLTIFMLTSYICTFGLDSSDDDVIEINAPHLSTLIIQGGMYLKKLLLLNVSSLTQAELIYWYLGGIDGISREEMLKGLLQSLSHVNSITLGDRCIAVLSRLEAKGFHFFEGTDDTSPGRLVVTRLIVIQLKSEIG